MRQIWRFYFPLFIACMGACNKGGRTESPILPPNAPALAVVPGKKMSSTMGLGSHSNCKDCLLRENSFASDGENRAFHLYVPKTKASAAVMVLHGHGGSADQILGLERPSSPLKVWIAVARRENLILIIPNGAQGTKGKRGWNDCRADGDGNPTSNDVLFLTELAQEVSRRFGVSRHFVTGMSNGGHMALRLATEAPHVFSGVAALSAAVAAQSECKPKQRPVSVLLMHGTADPILPYQGGAMAGNRGQVRSMTDSINFFLDVNGISAVGTTSQMPNVNGSDNSTVTRISYPKSQFGTRVEGYVITGGGHTEPSTSEFYGRGFKWIVGEQNRDIESAEVVWNFFKSL